MNPQHEPRPHIVSWLTDMDGVLVYENQPLPGAVDTKPGSATRPLPGIVPGQYDRPAGCLLSPRCPIAFDRCRIERPAFVGTDQQGVRCFTPLNEEQA